MSSTGRYERRELHRSRSLSSSFAIVITALLLLAAAAFALIPSGTLPISVDTVRSVLAGSGGVSIAIGAAIALVGLVWLLLALSSGRRSRHALARENVVLVVDDATLASGISASAARAARVAPEAVSTSVGRRRVDVTVSSDAGYDPQLGPAQRAVDDTIAALGARGRLTGIVKGARS